MNDDDYRNAMQAIRNIRDYPEEVDQEHIRNLLLGSVAESLLRIAYALDKLVGE